MSEKISAAEYSLSKIFSKDFEYYIPSFQRPYAWTVDQASELFDDLYTFHQTENDEEYFLGNIVLIKEENNPYAAVIDGQQRLTTLTILLATLAYRLNDEEQNKIHQFYITEPGNEFEGLDQKPRLTIRERDKDFFRKYVQDLAFDDLITLEKVALKNESQANIKENSKHFLDRIEKEFSGNTAKIARFVTFLVKHCFLVAVSTSNQTSAFRIFSVMNSRGLSLQATDIIKADVISQIAEVKQDEYNKRWEDMETELGREGFNDLFSFIRMIFTKKKAKKTLLEEFRQHVLKEDKNSEKLVEDILEPYAIALDIVKKSNKEDFPEANTYLRWLNRIDNSDWIPVAILFISQKHNSKYAELFFKKLERLAAYLHICAKNVNGRIERYGEVISALEGEHSMENPVSAIELTEPEIAEMKEALDGNVYELTSLRRNYIILRLNDFLSDDIVQYNPKVLTIEHVLPQKVDDTSEWAKLWPESDKHEKWVHKISNLVLLSRRHNSAGQNYDFETKKELYFKGENNVSPCALTTQVLNTQSWTEEYLMERQKKLLDVMFKYWELK